MNDKATLEAMLAAYLSSDIPSFYKRNGYCYIHLAKSGKFTSEFLHHEMRVTDEYGDRLWAAANGGRMPRIG